MKRREGYKDYVIVARLHELKEGGFSAEFFIEEHDADGVMETEYYLPNTFPTQDSAIDAGIQAGSFTEDKTCAPSPAFWSHSAYLAACAIASLQ